LSIHIEDQILNADKVLVRTDDERNELLMGLSNAINEISEDMKKIMRENTRALDEITKRSPY
jgi:hypothetical protein